MSRRKPPPPPRRPILPEPGLMEYDPRRLELPPRMPPNLWNGIPLGIPRPRISSPNRYIQPFPPSNPISHYLPGRAFLQFKCIYCQGSTDKISDLCMHLIRDHLHLHASEIVTDYYCILCKSYFTKDTKQLTRHLRCHLNYKPFTCMTCPSTQATRDEMGLHCQMMHGSQEPHYTKVMDHYLENDIKLLLSFTLRLQKLDTDSEYVPENVSHEEEGPLANFIQPHGSGNTGENRNINLADNVEANSVLYRAEQLMQLPPFLTPEIALPPLDVPASSTVEEEQPSPSTHASCPCRNTQRITETMDVATAPSRDYPRSLPLYLNNPLEEPVASTSHKGADSGPPKKKAKIAPQTTNPITRNTAIQTRNPPRTKISPGQREATGSVVQTPKLIINVDDSSESDLEIIFEKEADHPYPIPIKHEAIPTPKTNKPTREAIGPSTSSCATMTEEGADNTSKSVSKKCGETTIGTNLTKNNTNATMVQTLLSSGSIPGTNTSNKHTFATLSSEKQRRQNTAISSKSFSDAISTPITSCISYSNRATPVTDSENLDSTDLYPNFNSLYENTSITQDLNQEESLSSKKQTRKSRCKKNKNPVESTETETVGRRVRRKSLRPPTRMVPNSMVPQFTSQFSLHDEHQILSEKD